MKCYRTKLPLELPRRGPVPGLEPSDESSIGPISFRGPDQTSSWLNLAGRHRDALTLTATLGTEMSHHMDFLPGQTGQRIVAQHGINRRHDKGQQPSLTRAGSK